MIVSVCAHAAQNSLSWGVAARRPSSHVKSEWRLRETVPWVFLRLSFQTLRNVSESRFSVKSFRKTAIMEYISSSDRRRLFIATCGLVFCAWFFSPWEVALHEIDFFWQMGSWLKKRRSWKIGQTPWKCYGGKKNFLLPWPVRKCQQSFCGGAVLFYPCTQHRRWSACSAYTFSYPDTYIFLLLYLCDQILSK